MKKFDPHVGKIIIALLATAYFVYYVQTAGSWHFIDALNLVIHEAGHVVFFPFGDFMHILGGSLFQVLVPIVFSAYFFLRGEYYSGSLLLFWVGQNVVNVSIYAGDAVAMQLPLLGGDAVIHDWNYLLTSLHALQYTQQVSDSLYAAGLGLMGIAAVLSFVFALWPERTERWA